jgi:hypothetical protein
MNIDKQQVVWAENHLIGYYDFETAQLVLPDGYCLPAKEDFEYLVIDDRPNGRYNEWNEAENCRVFYGVEVEQLPAFNLDMLDQNQEFDFLNYKEKGIKMANHHVLDKFGNPIVNIAPSDVPIILDFFSRRDGRQYRIPTSTEWRAMHNEVTTRQNSKGTDYLWVYTEEDMFTPANAAEVLTVQPCRKPEDIGYQYPTLGIDKSLNLSINLAVDEK